MFSHRYILEPLILFGILQSNICLPIGISETTIQAPKSLIFQSLMEHPQRGWNVFEGGDWNGVEAATQQSITRTLEKSRNGSYSAKFILTKTDSDVAGSKRAELTDWNGRMKNPKSERWYGLSMFLPPNYIADPCEEIVFQWHAVNSVDLDGNSMKHPPIAMLTRLGRWVLMVKGKKTDLGTYETDTWTDWVLHIKFSYQSDGMLEIWKNGKLILRSVNSPNSYNDLVGNYFKIGIYKYGWKDKYPTNTLSRTLYYDEIRVGNENSSYSEVAPR